MSIRKIERTKGFVYQVRITNLSGLGKYKTFRTLRDAETFEREQLTLKSLDNGQSLSHNKVSLDEFCKNLWFPFKVTSLGQSTQDAYKSQYELHIRPIAGHKKLSDICPSDGDKLMSCLRKQGKNAKGINNILTTFKAILNYAVQRNYLSRNPLQIVRAPRSPQKHDSYWEANEASNFLIGIKDHYSYPLFVTALNTGMRRGELASLKWMHIDLARKQISVTGSKGRYGDSGLTKSRVDRVVPMNQRLIELFTELSKGKSPVEYVFTRDDGIPINPHHLYRLMNYLRIKTGVAKKIRFHDLRHTFASHFMMNGGNMTQLSLILGHTDFKTTKRYTHFSSKYLDGASNIVRF